MNRQQVLGATVRESVFLFKRYLKGFDDENRARQAPGLPNHLVWTLGHLAFAMERLATRIDEAPVDGGRFIADQKGCDQGRFGTEDVCFGSEPVGEAMYYPSLARAVEILDQSAERLAVAAEQASDAQLDATMQYGPMAVPVWKLVIRMVVHNGTHCGEVVDLRRAFGMGRVVG